MAGLLESMPFLAFIWVSGMLLYTDIS